MYKIEWNKIELNYNIITKKKRMKCIMEWNKIDH